MIETIIPKTKAKLLDDLNLWWCRITQDEDSHLKQGNWSMFAYDIACIRWQSFKVYTPNYFDRYVIEYIGKDKRLWDFLILRHWDYRFLYWHTYTEFNVWDRFNKWQILGKVNKSWISQNYHLHIELWRNNNNIKFQRLYEQELVINDKSFDLRLQRNLVSPKEINQLILDYIASFEWLRLEAYEDWPWRYSIWYWTKSFKWERITEEEARKRARIVIQSIRERYWLFDLDLNKQKAIVSFVYNIWSLTSRQNWLLQNWYYRALWNDFLLYNKANWKNLWWLVKRRESEFNLLTTR